MSLEDLISEVNIQMEDLNSKLETLLEGSTKGGDYTVAEQPKSFTIARIVLSGVLIFLAFLLIVSGIVLVGHEVLFCSGTDNAILLALCLCVFLGAVLAVCAINAVS